MSSSIDQNFLKFVKNKKKLSKQKLDTQIKEKKI